MKRLIASVLLCISILPLCACVEEKTAPILKEEDIRAVCELATLKCFYNNVAKVVKEPDYWPQVSRKMWIEHEGVATIGIDMMELEVAISDNTITMTMPKAKILTIKPNEKTLNDQSYVASEDNWLFPNRITVEDQQAAIKTGQEEMKAAIINNSGLFERAERRAKTLIESFITQMGEKLGQEYTIIWKNREA